jgi:hypothetical protein
VETRPASEVLAEVISAVMSGADVMGAVVVVVAAT